METWGKGAGDKAERSQRHSGMELETQWNGAGDKVEQCKRHSGTMPETQQNSTGTWKNGAGDTSEQ